MTNWIIPNNSSCHPLGQPRVDRTNRVRAALVCLERDRPLAEVDARASALRAKIEGRMADPADLQVLYRWSREYFVRQRRRHRFPGAYLVKAFNLAIKGLHYDTVMHGIVRKSSAAAVDDGRMPERA